MKLLKIQTRFSFIDGSIVPQYQDKPRKESQINDDYKSVIELFEELYKTAEENNCVLVSTVEDSRGSRFKQILQEEIIPESNISSVDLKIVLTFLCWIIFITQRKNISVFLHKRYFFSRNFERFFF